MQQPSKREARNSAIRFWVICQVLLFVVTAVFAVVTGLVWAEPVFDALLVIVSFAVMFASAPLSVLVRMQVYKRHWVGQAVTPIGYVRGARAFLVTLMAGLLVSGVILFVASVPLYVFGLYYVAAMVTLWFGYPHGMPMNTRLPAMSISYSKRL